MPAWAVRTIREYYQILEIPFSQAAPTVEEGEESPVD